MKNIAIVFTFFFAFSIQQTYSQCSAGQTAINVSIKPDNWGAEITWNIKGLGGSPTYGSGGPYTSGNTNIVNSQVCVTTGTAVTFTILDSEGDGICCDYGNGSYTVTVGGFIVASGGDYGTSESTSFTSPPFAVDASIQSVLTPTFVRLGVVDILGALTNKGTTAINNFNLNYSINNGTPVTQFVSGVNIPLSSVYSFTHSTAWQPSSTGTFTLKVWASNINGSADMDPSNDEITVTITVADPIPNIIDSYLSGTGTYTTIGNASNGVSKPNDLDFHPFKVSELWVVNEGIESTGGSTVTFFNAGLPSQTSIEKLDKNRWHFLSLPTALAFGDNGNWASSPGVKDANHGSSTFTGPSLWSGDMSIYANFFGGLGSHLDMVHQSPYSMGIAHEAANVYWVFDGWNTDIVRYDFVNDHGPGNDDHSDAKVHRYTGITATRQPAGLSHIPSHMVLDKNSGWLYISDTYNGRILRLNINTGNKKGNMPFNHEPLAESWEMENEVWEIFANTNLTDPSGIDIIDNRLIVSDNSNGNIIIYDIATKQELGRIYTGETGIRGIKIGHDGRIWYVDYPTNKVVRIEPDSVISPPVAIREFSRDENISIYPNPSGGVFNLQVSTPENVNLIIVDALGKQMDYGSELFSNGVIRLDLSHFSNGIYFLRVNNGNEFSTKKLLVNR